MVEYELLELSYETYIEDNNIKDTQRNKDMWNAAIKAALVVSSDYMAKDQMAHFNTRLRDITA